MRAIGYHNLIKVGLVSAIETENLNWFLLMKREVMKYFKENPLQMWLLKGRLLLIT